ncbi:MAG TPA: S-methyl-5'-thioinosine phosphorylase [Gammaproteobacteria bacterium]|nr:S-methyl-5'-thioinosine phosphorylase [Gammaproteobacteria bacterium]
MLGIIGGSGFYSAGYKEYLRHIKIGTEYSDAPVPIELIEIEQPFVFLARHGADHHIPPHEINYRANIDALRQTGVTEIIAINAVGGIAEGTGPGSIIIPDQLIDYTYGRQSTFCSQRKQFVKHVDFSFPFDRCLSDRLINAIDTINDESGASRPVVAEGVYGVTQGPRLETAAEIQKMRRDGCDIVGMTAMPEAVLAREADIKYGLVALSVNWAAGILPTEVTMEEIEAVMADGNQFLRRVLAQVIRA